MLIGRIGARLSSTRHGWSLLRADAASMQRAVNPRGRLIVPPCQRDASAVGPLALAGLSQRRLFSLGTRPSDSSAKSEQGDMKRLKDMKRPEDTVKPEPPSQATALHEDIYTIPNLLTLSRLVAAPFIGYFVLHEQHALALGLFVYAGVSDLVDGYVARRWNKKTVVGSVIDPMADKTLMTILTICLAVKGALPVWLATIILGRDIGLGIAAIYYRWISLPAPKTFRRYWDFSLPSAEVRPTTVSKYNTALQLVLVGLTTAAPVLPYDCAPILSPLQYIVATTTIWSGVSYLFSRDAVKMLNRPGK